MISDRPSSLCFCWIQAWLVGPREHTVIKGDSRAPTQKDSKKLFFVCLSTLGWEVVQFN